MTEIEQMKKKIKSMSFSSLTFSVNTFYKNTCLFFISLYIHNITMTLREHVSLPSMLAMFSHVNKEGGTVFYLTIRSRGSFSFHRTHNKSQPYMTAEPKDLEGLKSISSGRHPINRD